MGEIESGSSHEGGLPGDESVTSTVIPPVDDPPTGVSAAPEEKSKPRAKKPRAAPKPRGANKPVSEDTSGRPDLTKVAQERAAGRNKRIKRTKEEE